MKTARFWTGMVMLAVLAMIAFRISPWGTMAVQSGPVEGRVTYHGRPVSRGTIYFYSYDRENGWDWWAFIDDNGHYSCGPEWPRNPWNRTRYRMRVMLDPDKYPLGAPVADRGGSPVPPGEKGPESRLGGEGASGPRIVQASMASEDHVLTGQSSAPARRPTPGPANQVDLEVWLGTEPAHIDIDL
jgi:hypothetical protein